MAGTQHCLSRMLSETPSNKRTASEPRCLQASLLPSSTCISHSCTVPGKRGQWLSLPSRGPLLFWHLPSLLSPCAFPEPRPSCYLRTENQGPTTDPSRVRPSPGPLALCICAVVAEVPGEEWGSLAWGLGLSGPANLPRPCGPHHFHVSLYPHLELSEDSARFKVANGLLKIIFMLLQQKEIVLFIWCSSKQRQCSRLKEEVKYKLIS